MSFNRFGRKRIFCISAVAQLILSVGVAFINNYWFFIITTYVYGIFGSSGSYISGFVLSMCFYKNILSINLESTVITILC